MICQYCDADIMDGTSHFCSGIAPPAILSTDEEEDDEQPCDSYRPWSHVYAQHPYTYITDICEHHICIRLINGRSDLSYGDILLVHDLYDTPVVAQVDWCHDVLDPLLSIKVHLREGHSFQCQIQRSQCSRICLHEAFVRLGRSIFDT